MYNLFYFSKDDVKKMTVVCTVHIRRYFNRSIQVQLYPGNCVHSTPGYQLPEY